MARGKTTRIDRQEQIEMLAYLAGGAPAGMASRGGVPSCDEQLF
jgi:hypothetical protein